MELWELIARESVRDTIARYNHAGDSGRFDDMIATFAPDGVLELRDSGERAEGREALRAFFSNVKGDKRFRVMRHCVTNTRIDVVSRQEAHARSYFMVLTDIGLDHWGSYRDVLRPVDDTWLLAHRSVKTDAYAPNSFFGPEPA